MSGQETPNTFNLTLPIKLGDITVYENQAIYNIWDTDYETYTVVYSCIEISNTCFWIKTLHLFIN